MKNQTEQTQFPAGDETLQAGNVKEGSGCARAGALDNLNVAALLDYEKAAGGIVGLLDIKRRNETGSDGDEIESWRSWRSDNRRNDGSGRGTTSAARDDDEEICRKQMIGRSGTLVAHYPSPGD
jgi:hypothetical protein